MTLSYALVTPARDEVRNLRRLARCLVRQTVAPLEWVIVDDGSTDGTAELAAELAHAHPWIRLLRSPGVAALAGPLGAGRRDGRDVVAFLAGLAALPEDAGVVVKLDADVSLGSDFFARLLEQFAADPSLGIAGGLCHEREQGEWRPRHVTGLHVRGATRAYRRACLEDVLPLERRLGWDGLDELRANVRGWTTRSFRELPFRHHRRVGERDGALRAWASQGETAHWLGYRLSYLLVRSLHHARRDRAALAMAAGYVAALVRRAPRHADAEVHAYLRRYQSPLRLLLRAREALGVAR